MNSNHKFDVAISFSGKQRDYARALAQQIKKFGVRVFFDEWEAGQLWGEDLSEKLFEIYEQMATFVIIIHSQDYIDGAFPTHEKKAAFTRMIQEKGTAYILPIKFDHASVGGPLRNISYINKSDKNVSEIAELLAVHKLGKAAKVKPPTYTEVIKTLYKGNDVCFINSDIAEQYGPCFEDEILELHKGGATICFTCFYAGKNSRSAHPVNLILSAQYSEKFDEDDLWHLIHALKDNQFEINEVKTVQVQDTECRSMLINDDLPVKTTIETDMQGYITNIKTRCTVGA